MKKGKVSFRVECQYDIGFGHIIRCIALGQMLMPEFSVHIFSMSIPADLVIKTQNLGIQVTQISSENVFLKTLNEDSIVVIDHYELDSEYQKKIKDLGCKLVCIDDLHNQVFHADLIINHAPGITVDDYQAQSYTQFALGLDYALLRPAFLSPPERTKIIGQPEILFICFGGSDIKNLSQQSLREALVFSKFKKIKIVTGPAYKENDSLNNLISESNTVELYHDISGEKMQQLMLSADVALVPSSGILLEALSSGCIVITGTYIDNQRHLYANCKAADLVIDGGCFNSKTLQTAFDQAFSARQETSPCIDGDSGRRILRLFQAQQLKLRLFNTNDCRLLFDWANDDEVRKQSFNQKKISWEDHQRWFQKADTSPETKIFILEKNNTAIGQVRFDRKDNYWLIDFSIDLKYRGCGLGSQIVKQGISLMKGEIRALVKQQNTSSCMVFEKNNFCLLSHANSVNHYSISI